MNQFGPDQINALLQAAGRDRTIFLIGAGGCGMSGLGHLLLDLGYRVAGSDLVRNREVQQLCDRGAQIYHGHKAEQLITANPILVVYSPAVPLDNPELAAAWQQETPIVRRAVLLAALANNRRTICVAGMHGKTTTTAMLAFALDRLGQTPSFAVGAVVPQLPRQARLAGTDQSEAKPNAAPEATAPEYSNCFVVEADESDGTLALFRPDHAIILNVDEEHLDFFKDIGAVCHAFNDFAGHVKGRLVYCADDPRLAELCAGRPGAVSFGFDQKADYRVVPISGGCSAGGLSRKAGANTNFEVWHGAQWLGQFAIKLVGRMNTSNAAAVIVLMHQLGCKPEAIASAIALFEGVARRQHELFKDEHVRVFDDYGHHPQEIRPTLQAFKDLGCKRLLVVFQPHRFTRTQHLMAKFAGCFGAADKLWLTEIYAASEPALDGVSSQALAEAIRLNGQSVELAALDEIVWAVRSAMAPGDLVLFMGAGSITRAAHQLANLLRAEQASRTRLLFDALAERLSSDTVLRRDKPLAKHTTWKVGGKADIYVQPASERELAQVLELTRTHRMPFRLIGCGSNLLVMDGGIRGVVICLSHPAFSRIEVKQNSLYCGAGAKLKSVLQTARNAGLSGLEFLEGIPGTVGGALRMNAGAHGSSLFGAVQSARYMDYSGHVLERPGSDIHANYRDCPLFKDNIALSAVLIAHPSECGAIDQLLQAYSQKRRLTQPTGSSAGCVFKNTSDMPAGRLVEELGLKGLRMGGAAVSDIHANFIVNLGAATAQDILNLIDTIKVRARADRGIELETEVEIVGDNVVACDLTTAK